jgi:hypothetical protein
LFVYTFQGGQCPTLAFAFHATRNKEKKSSALMMTNQGEGLSPLLFHFPLEFVFRKVQENKEKLHLEEAHSLLATVINLLAEKKMNRSNHKEN